jgi:hypothetical protein
MAEPELATQEQPEQQEETSVEDVSPEMQKALDDGWRPQEEWEGDKDSWVDYQEFNFRGELMERIKSQTRKLTKQEEELLALKDGFKQYQEHANKLAKAEYEQKLKDLKDIKRGALEEQDYDTVIEADERIAELKEGQKEPKEEPQEASPEIHPDIKEWIEDNEWYVEDPVLRGAVDSVAKDIFEKDNSLTPKQVLAETKRIVKGRFPDAFGGQRPPVNAVTETQTSRRTQRGGKVKYSKSALSEEQRRVGSTFVQAGALKSLDEYAQQLGELGELG